MMHAFLRIGMLYVEQWTQMLFDPALTTIKRRRGECYETLRQFVIGLLYESN